MPTSLDLPGSGIQATTQVVADANELPVLRQRQSIVDLLQNSQTPIPPAPPPIIPPSTGFTAVPTTTGAPEPNPITPPPDPHRAVTLPTPAPILPTDSPRVQDRINRLYAQRQQANEDLVALRDVVAQQNSRIDALLRSASGAPPSHLGPPQDPAQPAGQFISRAELLEILRQERQVSDAQSAVRSAHVVSRIEAERDFPDVFTDPELRSSAEQIWAADRILQSDPHGPYKAAALARGLRPGQSSSAPAAAASADARKALMSTGASIPESSAGQSTQTQRYFQALARARATQDPLDFIQAQRIAQGLA